jgi:DNA-3-methyladenine glycosylase II
MVLLPWTPPYDWAWMVGFLQARAVAGVERFHEGGYSRSFGVEGHRGLIHLAPDEEAQGLRVTLSPGLQPVAEICYARIGQLFDLACDPRQVAARWALWRRRGRGCACRGRWMPSNRRCARCWASW